MAKKKQKNKVVEYAKLEHKVAALWTRVSTERQENENCSLDNQKKSAKSLQRLMELPSSVSLVVNMKVPRMRVSCIRK